MRKIPFAWLAALAVPIFYLCCYTPYGMDTTDFGYFYAYAWRILEGQIPYRDFFYIKPAFPLYWHAFWLWVTPFEWQILAGKAGFCITLLAASWLGALYLRRMFNFAKMGLDLPLFATAAFVFSIHSFPHMPWHTADGILFCAGSLYCASLSLPIRAGILCAAALLCKQSFLFMPLAILLLLWLYDSKHGALIFAAAALACVMAWFVWLVHNGAWDSFRAMTTGQLAASEAIEAGILIYLRQNWFIPALALAPFGVARIWGKKLPDWLAPAWCYLLVLAIWYIWQAYQQEIWLGFGASWPTLFMALGGIAVLWPRFWLMPVCARTARPLLAAIALAASLLIAWSAAISGGYKIPAMFAAPLLFAFFLWHCRFFGLCKNLQWGALLAGLLMFFIGYQFPYTFPVRPLRKMEMTWNAGDIYPQAKGVKVDRDIYDRLKELKALRQKYGPNYKTLPGFSFAYYLNGDKPVIASDWLIDWEINGKIEELYQQMLDKNVIVFMERDQMDAKQADAYARAGYGAPQLVRKNWRVIEETPHFVVMQKP